MEDFEGKSMYEQMRIEKQLNRAKKLEKFEDIWLNKIKEKTDVKQRPNGSYTFNSELGIMDFFPKADKVLIRKENKWIPKGLTFLRYIFDI